MDTGQIGGESARVAQLLDDHHLVVVGSCGQGRDSFARSLAGHFETLDGTRVVRIDGKRVRDVESLCRQLEARLGRGQGAERSIDGMTALLREERAEDRHEFFLWENADELLEADVGTFGRVTNALLAVSAEREFVSADVLMLQRWILVGGEKLGAYAEDAGGQLQSWLAEDGVTPFWEVASCVERPPVLTYRLSE